MTESTKSMAGANKTTVQKLKAEDRLKPFEESATRHAQTTERDPIPVIPADWFRKKKDRPLRIGTALETAIVIAISAMVGAIAMWCCCVIGVIHHV